MSNPIEKKAWCYDIECYPNFFSAVFIHQKSDEERRFIVFNDMRDARLSINDIVPLLDFLRYEVRTLIGYNSQSYDDTILKHLMLSSEFMEQASPADITRSCKILSNKIIDGQSRRDGDDKQHSEDPYINNLRSRKLFGSLDLLLLFNTINRVGLKQIAINLRWPEIIDLPHPPDHIVVSEEVDEIMYYNRNDVLITRRLLQDRSEVIQYRRDYTVDFNTNVLNSNDTNIAKTVVRKYYSEVTNKKFEEYKDKRTYYKNLRLAACVSPKIKFMTRPFVAALNSFRTKTIDPNRAIKEMDKAEKKKDKLIVHSDGTMSIEKAKKESKKQFEHILKTKYLTHTLGLGGIHSNNDSEIIEETSEYELIDADVTSYYPSIIIQEKLFPHHLGPEFITVYRDKLFYPRLQAKAEGKSAFAEMLKIALNSTFGLTKSVHSWLYDPHVAVYICVSGQLFLMMLMEKLEYYTDCVVVYSNTDGITVKVPKGQKEQFYAICKQWSEYTGFGLEYTRFKKMIMRDVNNYLMITYDEKKPIKVKGGFNTKSPITAGYVYPVIPKALHAYYTQGISPEVFIKSQNDIYDFMKAERTSPKKYDVTFRKLSSPDEVEHLNKNNRWIVTRGNPDEGKLKKTSIVEFIKGQKNKRFGKPVEMQKGHYCTLLNDLSNPYQNISMYKLDYNFYIGEVYKVIKDIKPRSLETPKKVYQQMSII